jgi:hypothetical protein
MNRRDVLLSTTYAILGLVFTFSAYPQLRPLQILLPFVFGGAAGVSLGRARWRTRASTRLS